ncbi:MAG: phosphate/phosphite/phosphonate ABC transporter substrate-binding protein [Pseudomonadota bacterium]
MLRIALSLILSVLVACGGEAPPPDDDRSIHAVAAAPLLPEGCTPGTVYPDTLKVVSIPYMGTDTTGEVFQDIATGISEELHMPVEWTIGKDYESAVNQLLSGQVHVASLSPLAYVKAREQMPCLKLLATQVSRGDTRYSSFILVRKDRGITSVKQLEGKRIAFVNPASASGFLFPMATLIDAGLDPARVIKDAVFLEAHPKVIAAVVAGEVDAGATFFGAVTAARAQQVDTGVLRVLALAGRIPFDAVVAHPDVDPELARRVQAAFLALNSTTDRGRTALGHLIEINGWVLPSEEVYETVRTTLSLVRAATRGKP